FDESEEFEQAISMEGEREALKHLEKGRPVYYSDETFQGLLVQRSSNGCEALVRVDSDGHIIVVRPL
ncbi:hypothetical protein O6268_23670, partial [Salmonella enterica subsp. enterica]